MQTKPLLKLLPLTLLALTSCLSWAQVDPNRTVATVNGEAIKGSEYYRRMEFLPGVGKRDSDNFFEAPPGFLTLEQLITERLVLQLAKDKGVSPTDLQVQAELKARQDDNPNLLKDWAAQGRSADELNRQIQYELAQFNIQTFGVTITDTEVQNFYNSNPTMYTVPKQAKLKVIVVDTEADKTKVDSDLGAGKDFSDVAKSYSVDVSKSTGGDIGAVPYDFLSPAAKDAVAKIKIGQATDWVASQTPDGQKRFVKFQLVDVIAEKKMPLDDKLKRSIRRRMLLDRGAVKNDIRKEMAAIRAKAQINITEPEFAAIYKKFIDTYLKQTGG